MRKRKTPRSVPRRRRSSSPASLCPPPPPLLLSGRSGTGRRAARGRSSPAGSSSPSRAAHLDGAVKCSPAVLACRPSRRARDAIPIEDPLFFLLSGRSGTGRRAIEDPLLFLLSARSGSEIPAAQARCGARDAVAARADGGRLRLRRRSGHPGRHQGLRGARRLLLLRHHCHHCAEHRRHLGGPCCARGVHRAAAQFGALGLVGGRGRERAASVIVPEV